MSVRDEIVTYAQRQIGCAYSYVPSGGIEGSSYNCSFLTYCAYRAAGLRIPTWQGHQNGDGSQSDWVRDAGHWTTDTDKLRPGDLVFFGTNPYNTGHVGISLGGSRMIDSIPNGGVQERRLQANFVGGGWPLRDDEDEEFFPMKREFRFSTSMNIRTEPSTAKGAIVGKYEAGEVVVADGITVGDGYVWATYKAQRTGKRRYVAVGTTPFAEAL